MDDWMNQVREKEKRGRALLFSRESECLQPLLAEICLQKRRTLALWALRCAEIPVKRLRTLLPGEERPAQALTMSGLWAQGAIKMPAAKRAILDAHAAARGLASPEAVALCHAVGQACATVHVETHAIGLPVYELTALVRRYGIENCLAPIQARLEEYLVCLRMCARETDLFPWADFLLDDSRLNREYLLRFRDGR